jgi:hypothetical protein
LVAVLAVDGTVAARTERHESGLAAVGADGFIHFTLLTLVALATGSLAGLTAGRATGRFVFETTGSVEFLFASGENEFGAAVTAGKSLVLIH